MTLTDGQVIAAGNVALRLLDLPERAEISAQPDGEYRYIVTRLSSGETLTASMGVDRGADKAAAVMTILDGLTNDISETDEFWAIAFPRCIEHAHAASYVVSEDHATLRCPATGYEFRRVTW